VSTDRLTGLFWVCVSAIVAAASYRLGLGTMSAPGSGFVPFGAASLLGLLSIALFAKAGPAGRIRESSPLFRGTRWMRVFLVLVALFAYASLVPAVGFGITTFLLMTFLFWIAGRQKAWRVAVYALFTTGLSYYVFSKWLNLQFPAGPLGF